MDLKEITEIIVNNGTAIGILIYFVVRDWKFTQRLDTTLSTLEKSVDNVEKMLKHINNRKEDK